ncbi:MFS transporter [Nocardioides sp. Kera G14]|uniref:MFS transporter n=1 Tax=Nocardioides sp. Kera G14 TaxID=2884264 RepID=UPI001D12E3A3|nr:MFS transporter [Nocardioides sp. Kera G14]UDY22664.1 MFS transporter [Nocardioides sp. Kera G14]
MSRLLTLIAPDQLGVGFRLLLAQSWLNALGGGMATAAGPLLVASRTHDARLVSLAALLDWLPGFAFGLYAGMLADRHDRRVLMMIGNALRAAVLAVLVGCLAFGAAPIVVVLLTMLALGIADTLAQSAGRTVLPMIVDRVDLGIANARFQFGWMGINRLIAPPLGAGLFVVAQWVPFVTQLVCAGLAIVLLAQLALPPHGVAPDDRRHPVSEIRDGWLWAWHNPAVRTLNLQIVCFNLAYGAVWATMVLYAHERLGLGDLGYGLLLAAIAVGGVIGSFTYGLVERHVSIGDIMRYGLVWETSSWALLGWTDQAWVAFVVLGLFGVHEGYWGATYSSVTQRLIPHDLQGRVGSVYMVLLTGGLVLGAAVAGPMSHHWGITAPYWFGFASAAICLAALWREIGRLAREDEQVRAA